MIHSARWQGLYLIYFSFIFVQWYASPVFIYANGFDSGLLEGSCSYLHLH